MTKADLIRTMAVGTNWRTEFFNPLRPENSVVPERTVIRHRSNGCWFSPTPWSNREGFLDWPKASNITVEADGAITLSFDDGQPYARYWRL